MQSKSTQADEGRSGDLPAGSLTWPFADLDLCSAKYTLSTLGNYLTSLGHTAL